MTFLLDVNGLIALASTEHEFHRRLILWLLSLDRDSDALASCATTELGVVRILPQTSLGQFTVKEAQEALARVKETSILRFDFIVDDLGADKLPAWVRHPRQTTDGHLAALAKAHGATLATFDRKIHGALVIPHA